jgi:hypothetical protein
MSALDDPTFRRLRAKAAGLSSHGNVEAAAEARKQLAILRVERELKPLIPTLDTTERAHLASLILGGVSA